MRAHIPDVRLREERMEVRKVDLFGYFGLDRGEAEKGTLTAYLHADLTELKKKRVRPAMLVIPGGGYCSVSQREDEPIAVRFFAEGFDCFVLHYDVAPHCYPMQILEAGMAMLYLRREAAAFGIDRIAAVGFSAGGHLAGCISFLWDDPALKAAFGDECRLIRPDAAVLCYPVVTSDERFWHEGSFRNFCKDKVPFETYSLEKRVHGEVPPCFLWATTTDDCVPVENALLLYGALKRAGGEAEMHLYEKGWHGLSTSDIEVYDEPDDPFYARTAGWFGLAVSFLRAHGYVVRSRER